ncbi:hypothetical protein [Aureimonas sp. AU40]|uniref:hypothetical protein n=1 Tax=Aureimonas sp. AU40 TaxID=1637747 RepID=UPI00078666E8|nr:hypothetical protein [Aureimonas sp. AU40]
MIKRIVLGAIAALLVLAFLAETVLAQEMPASWQGRELILYQQRQICNSQGLSVTDAMMTFEKETTFKRVAASLTKPNLKKHWDFARRYVEGEFGKDVGIRDAYCAEVAKDIAKRMETRQKVDQLLGDMPLSQ